MSALATRTAVVSAGSAAGDIVRPAWRLGGLVAVLGVVYGDIGTSPLYAFQASLRQFPASGVADLEIMGVLSLIFWSLMLVVTVKYVLLVMRADNRGEGGIPALMALAQRVCYRPITKRAVAIIGITGTCLLFGDGTITPAISVLSALEGLEVSAPGMREYVMPLAVLVVLALFSVQARGIGSMGRLFGPVMALWFAAIGVLGLLAILRHPFVLYALSPGYGLALCLQYRTLAFIVLGSVVLAVTGAEALYADMGHFGANPIRLSWLFFVLPCLVLNYFGQGALVIHDHAAMRNPFFLLVPPPLRLPMVILAILATVIASQALISGAFSIVRQCVQLGFLPRLTVRHTSGVEEGQIYLPQINVMLAAMVLILVLSFKTSGHLAAAYGIAVTGTFICTGLLATVVFRRQFGWSRLATIAVFGPLLALDCAFFGANSLKIVQGGWVPVAIAVVLLGLMSSWNRGRALLLARWRQDSLPLAPFLARLPQSRILRVPGIAVFLTGNLDFVPAALLHNLKHNKVLHERVFLVSVNNLDVPECRAERRLEVTELSGGVYRVAVSFGFMETPNIPRTLALLPAQGVAFDPMQVSYFLGREMLVPAMVPKLPRWRLWLFLAMARNAVSATEFFRIPSDRVVELGVRVAI
jgi:KUP system potassium uptake protein